jgi:hypothetical protein
MSKCHGKADKLGEVAAEGPVPFNARPTEMVGGRRERTNSTDPPSTIKFAHHGVCVQSRPLLRLHKFWFRETRLHHLSPPLLRLRSHDIIQLIPTRLTEHTPDRSCNLNLRRPTELLGHPQGSRCPLLRLHWLADSCAVGRLALSRPHTASSFERARKKGNFSAA